MYVVRFSKYRVVEFSDPSLYQHHVGKWMEIREAENSYLLGQIPSIISSSRQSGQMAQRLFALQDGEHIVAAAILFAGGCLGHTWASPEMVAAIVDGLIDARCHLTSAFGPAHIAHQLAEMWGQRTGQGLATERAERVYQLTRIAHQPPEGGRLEAAAMGDVDLLAAWMRGFIEESQFETRDYSARQMTELLIRQKALWVWKQPGAVSMAGSTSPTTHGISINFVYTPTEFRGQGHAKSVVAALGKQLLASGYSYCFILTDVDDVVTNRLYQSVGARTIGELMRCKIQAQGMNASPPQPVRPAAG